MKLFLVFSLFFLQACSNLPTNIRTPPAVDIQLHHVLNNSNQYLNQPVRWGGTVINVENEPDKTTLQVLFYPLDYFGRPRKNRQAFGRFASVSNQFLDPAIYSEGTEVTIAGILQDTTIKKIGNKEVSIPVIAMTNLHIWPKYRQIERWNYYDNFHYPYYSYRRYPYYYRGGYLNYNYCY